MASELRKALAITGGFVLAGVLGGFVFYHKGESKAGADKPARKVGKPETREETVAKPAPATVSKADEDWKRIVKAYVIKNANDPEGLEFLEWGVPRVAPTYVKFYWGFEGTDPDPVKQKAILVSLRMRAKNGLGAKMLYRMFFLVRNGEVIASDKADGSAKTTSPLYPYGIPGEVEKLPVYR